MSVLYLDAFSGISGDMVLGLLVDLGVPLATIEAELAKLPVSGYRLTGKRESRTGIEGTRVLVECDEQHHHRTWADIDAMLGESDLQAPVKKLSRAIFRRIGVAEARVHGMPLEKVHFHEVGALDSIVDIVGAAAGLIALEVETVVCSPLPLARGMVETAHGRFPLPAPATAAILEGCPVVDGACDRELVTPTGAAIAAEVAEFADLPAMTVQKVAYGVGTRKLADRPNLLRGILGDSRGRPALQADRVCVLETHIDDASPEWLGPLLERLLGEGALDAGFSPLQMKKNRPGLRLTVVAEPERAAELARLIMRESSAIGVRRYDCQRYKLRREVAAVATAVGEAKVKLIYEGDELVRVTPEHDSCLHLARQSGKPLPEVYRLVEQAAAVFFKPRTSNLEPGL
ncbi:MAG: nickel pincer cofactor biosynthesis protein LarC [Desulfuromonadales bacterium]|nr:nickel pincer cofactor biosynthesis protein LarC [Desulfuromonadales bacterium]NIR34382.1 nickel pincer cofactor biosynthesis protein LarC [Desulfuromonadales bacterium]NIS44348.1 nickel pincer cofactor biosynthesis protein LarC [Desulfuromonadales bacterium]